MISASSMYAGRSSSNSANNNSGTAAVQDKFDRFEAWLASNGARFEQVRSYYNTLYILYLCMN